MPRPTHLAAAASAAVALLAGLLLGGCGDDGDEQRPTMIDARDYINVNLPDTIATLLYENPGSRAEYEQRARDEHPDVWADIGDDGEVTFEEFREIPDVDNAVLHYTGEFLEGFQNEMVDLATEP